MKNKLNNNQSWGVGGDNRGKKGKGCPGTCIKYLWTKIQQQGVFNVEGGEGRAGKSNGRKWGQE